MSETINKNQFEVGAEAIYFFQGNARIVEITKVTPSTVSAGKLTFTKQRWNWPKGRANTSGSLKHVSDELLIEVEKTIARDNQIIRKAEDERDCELSDQAEFEAWSQTDEGRAGLLMQSDWIGTDIKIEHFNSSFSRGTKLSLIGFNGREVDDIRVEQRASWLSGKDYEILDRPEIAFNSGHYSSGQAKAFQQLLQKATDYSTIYDQDTGKAWIRKDDRYIAHEIGTVELESIAIENS